MLELYNDSNNKVFDFKLDIEGTKKEDLDVRMIATFEKHNRNYVFFGKIHEDNIFRIEIPALTEIEQNTFGDLKLEVIAEDMIFNTWDSQFQIKSKTNVKVNEVNSFEKKKDKTANIKVDTVEVNEKSEVVEEESTVAEKVEDTTQPTDQLDKKASGEDSTETNVAKDTGANEEVKQEKPTQHIKQIIEEIQQPEETKKPVKEKKNVEVKLQEKVKIKEEAPKKKVAAKKPTKSKVDKILENMSKPKTTIKKHPVKTTGKGEVMKFSDFF